MAPRALLPTALVAGLLSAVVPHASADSISPGGYTATVGDAADTRVSLEEEDGSWTSISWRSDGAPTELSGYSPAECEYSEFSGSTFCPLRPLDRSPFVVRGSGGNDTFGFRPGTASGVGGYGGFLRCVGPVTMTCPRTFHVFTGTGDDVVLLATVPAMPGVRIDLGPGDDYGLIRRGPLSGVIAGGAGDDLLYTSGTADDPTGGPFEVSCGTGADVVVPGARDRVAGDCEVVCPAFTEQPPASRTYTDLPRGCRVKRLRLGRATLARREMRFTLDRPARVAATLTGRVRNRRATLGDCPRIDTRGRPVCYRTVKRTRRYAARRGSNRLALPFAVRVPGRYMLTISATDETGIKASRSVRFRAVRARSGLRLRVSR